MKNESNNAGMLGEIYSTGKKMVNAAVMGVVLYAGGCAAIRPTIIPPIPYDFFGQRYEQIDTRVTTVDGEEFQVPVVVDNWQQARDEAFNSFKGLVEMQNSYSNFKVNENGMSGDKSYQDCVRWESNWITDHNGNSRTEEKCASEVTRYYTSFNIKFEDLKSSAYADDYLVFFNSSGAERRMDLDTIERAYLAATNLKHVTHLSKQIKNDHRTPHLKIAQEQAQRKLDTAQKKWAEYQTMLNCVKGGLSSTPLKDLEYHCASKHGIEDYDKIRLHKDVLEYLSQMVNNISATQE